MSNMMSQSACRRKVNGYHILISLQKTPPFWLLSVCYKNYETSRSTLVLLLVLFGRPVCNEEWMILRKETNFGKVKTYIGHGLIHQTARNVPKNITHKCWLSQNNYYPRWAYIDVQRPSEQLFQIKTKNLASSPKARQVIISYVVYETNPWRVY